MPVWHGAAAKASSVAQPSVASLCGEHWRHLFSVVAFGGTTGLNQTRWRSRYMFLVFFLEWQLLSIEKKDNIMINASEPVSVKKTFPEIKTKECLVLCRAICFFPVKKIMLCALTGTFARVMSINCTVYSGAHSLPLCSHWMKPSTWPSLLSTVLLFCFFYGAVGLPLQLPRSFRQIKHAYTDTNTQTETCW